MRGITLAQFWKKFDCGPGAFNPFRSRSPGLVQHGPSVGLSSGAGADALSSSAAPCSGLSFVSDGPGVRSSATAQCSPLTVYKACSPSIGPYRLQVSGSPGNSKTDTIRTYGASALGPASTYGLLHLRGTVGPVFYLIPSTMTSVEADLGAIQRLHTP